MGNNAAGKKRVKMLIKIKVSYLHLTN